MTGQNFQGDLLLVETPDGGDCVLNDGLLSADHAFGTAVFISLFGGNKADAGAVETRGTWWGNTLQGILEKEKIVSRFQNFIHKMPMTVKNIKDAKDMASLDLEWIADEGIADEIKIDARSEGINRLRLFVQVIKAGKTIYETDYGVLWGAGINGI
jgi:phage gp46-like protein